MRQMKRLGMPNKSTNSDLDFAALYLIRLCVLLGAQYSQSSKMLYARDNSDL
jgi:hypothetical protein